jgi:hypothetical protein
MTVYASLDQAIVSEIDWYVEDLAGVTTSSGEKRISGPPKRWMVPLCHALALF